MAHTFLLFLFLQGVTLIGPSQKKMYAQNRIIIYNDTIKGYTQSKVQYIGHFTTTSQWFFF
jgi:hypothetical protein